MIVIVCLLFSYSFNSVPITIDCCIKKFSYNILLNTLKETQYIVVFILSTTALNINSFN